MWTRLSNTGARFLSQAEERQEETCIMDVIITLREQYVVDNNRLQCLCFGISCTVFLLGLDVVEVLAQRQVSDGSVLGQPHQQSGQV